MAINTVCPVAVRLTILPAATDHPACPCTLAALLPVHSLPVTCLIALFSSDMSWQQYVDSNLVGTGMVTAAGIYDLQGNPWAYSAGFAAQIAEVAAVSAHFAAPAGLAATGATIAGV